MEDLFSDHSAFAVSLYTPALLRSARKKLIYKATDIGKYQSYLNTIIDPSPTLDSPLDIDTAVEQLTAHIQAAASEAAPRPSNRPRATDRDIHFWSPEVEGLKLEKRRLWRVWTLSRNPRDKTAFNRASKCLSDTLARVRKHAFDGFVEQLKPGDPQHNLWRVTKRIRRPLKRIPPVQRTDGRWCRPEMDRANAFAEHLEAVFTPFERCSPEDAAETVRLLAEPSRDADPIRPITEDSSSLNS